MGLCLWTNKFCFQNIALFLLYYVVLSLRGGGGGVGGGGDGCGSKQLLSLNPTAVMIVLLLGLWLLLGCDNIKSKARLDENGKMVADSA